MTQTTIRTYREGDLQRLCEIAVEAWREYFEMLQKRMGAELFEAAVGDWQAEKTRQVREFCRDHPDWCLVTQQSGSVVGFITYRLDTASGIGVIGNNAVAPSCQGEGLGTELYSRVLQIFRDEGLAFAKVTTGMDPFHARARRAYEKVGFRAMTPMVDYYREL
ncbi:MAG: GNAT family N-acetyltransferase [Armatimonadota bacterium]